MTLPDFLARFESVEQTEDGFLVHCPAHADSEASLRVAVSDKGKVLLRCRAGCETPRVMEAMGLSMRTLASMKPGDVVVQRATSQDVPASPTHVAALAVNLDRWARAWDSDDAAPVRDYAARRFGISVEDGQRLGLGFAFDDRRKAEVREADPEHGLPGGPRLVVPFRDRQGVPRGFQARSIEPDAGVRWLGPKSPEGESWSKVGFLPGSSGWEEVVVTEGPGDGLTACALGYDSVLIRGAGLVSNPVVVEQIAALIGDGVAVVAGDADTSGQRFTETLTTALAARGIRTKRLTIPAPHGDLTEWREADPETFRREAVRAIITAAEIRSEAPRDAIVRWGADFVQSATDVAGARLLQHLIREAGSDVRYSPEAGFFLLADGVWRPDRLDKIRTYAHGVSDELRAWLREVERDEEDVDLTEGAKALRRYARHAQTTRGIDSMIRELQALPGVSVDVNDFDRHPDLLACRNGVVNLRTGDLQDHDPRLLLTRRVDLDYDPHAKADRWERFLVEVFPGHDALPAYMRRLVGYGITGSTAEQAFAVLWGTGANGKSVFTDTLTEVFRELTVTTPFSTFEDRGSGGIPNDLAALKGARLVMAAEGEQGRPMAEAVLKRVTGRDLISARFMRKEFFEFRPTFLLLLATNFKPSFKGQDEGLWRRVKLIPWERFFAPAERDHRLGDVLLSEAQGIFAWAVRGAVEWYAGGLQDPDVIRDSTKEYRETSDALVGFFPGQYVVDPNAERLSGKVLFDDYLEWCDEENLPAKERWTRRTFFAAVEERGAVKRHARTGVAFDGIRKALSSDHPEEPRAERPAVADSSPVTTPTPTPSSGPSLGDVL